MPSIFNTSSWKPRIIPGYFYIGDDEYYLYENKQSQQLTAVFGGTFTLPKVKFSSEAGLKGPVVLTDATGEYTLSMAQSNPFVKMYEYPLGPEEHEKTSDKYRRRYNLTGKKQYMATATGDIPYTFALAEHEFYINWGSPNTSGYYTPTLYVNPTGNNLVLEWEDPLATGGLYTIPDIDLNPAHSSISQRSIIAITDIPPTGQFLTVRVGVENYIHARAGSNPPTIPVIAFLTDIYGAPVQSQTVTFTAAVVGAGIGTWDGAGGTSINKTTEWDGSALAFWIPPAGGIGSAYPDKGIEITVSHAYITSSVSLHVGGKR